MNRAMLLLLPLLAAGTSSAGAEPQSLYSDLKIADCKTIETFEEGVGAKLSCPGIQGIDVIVTEGDLRFYVGYGKDADQQCAMQQTFGPFNSLGPRIEWRMENGKPYATILRWVLDSDTGGGKKTWLVVTRLGGPQTCHVAYIEGAMPNANQRARDEADDRARSFRCGTDPVLIVARQDTDTSGLYPRDCVNQ